MYTLHTDPGHAWLEVSKAEIKALGIQNQISACSYQRATTVYLEEDCDLALFAKAKGWTPGGDAPIIEKYYDYDAPIRQYSHYRT